jgi:hypothetical protein
MKKIFISMLLGMLLALAAACSQSSGTGIDETADSAYDGRAVGYWGNDFYFPFLGEVNCLGLFFDIVGDKETSKFINEFFEPTKMEKEYLPLTYRAIMHFNVSEETFREYNSAAIEFNNQHGTSGSTYTENEIAALFCGDEAEMLDRLRSPYTFVSGGEVFTVYELAAMGMDDIIRQDFDPEELYEYCGWIQGELAAPPEGDEEYFGGRLDSLRRNALAIIRMEQDTHEEYEENDPEEYNGNEENEKHNEHDEHEGQEEQER